MIRCPACRNEIPPNDFNVSTDQAFCRNCNRDFRYGELAANIWPDEQFDPTVRPRHVRIVDDGFQQTITYKRISPAVLFLVPFVALWGGGSMYGIYLRHLLAGDPIPQRDVLLGLPFLFGTIVLLSVIAYLLFCKLTLHLQGPESWVFRGVGPVGRRDPFDAEAVEAVRLVDTDIKSNNVPMKAIELQFRDAGALRFGAMLTDESKQYLANYLAQRLVTS